ncbi:MAG: hypothetical protein ACJ8GO_05475, partial [Ramlibacter sp.]
MARSKRGSAEAAARRSPAIPTTPKSASAPAASAHAGGGTTAAAAAALLALTIALAPAVGVPGEYLLQDTLKSMLVSFAALGAALLFFWDVRNRDAQLDWHAVLWLPLLLMAYALGSMAWSHPYLAGV